MPTVCMHCLHGETKDLGQLCGIETAHLLKEAKLMNTSADLCALTASGVLQGKSQSQD